MWSLLMCVLWWPVAMVLARWRRQEKPRHILLVQTAKIGDMVCTLPLIEAAASICPTDGSVSLVHAPLTTPLVAHHPGLTRRYSWAQPQLRGWRGRWRVAHLLWTKQIDTVIVASPSLLWLTIPFCLGVSRRVAILPPHGGRTWRWGERFLTHARRHDPQQLLLQEWQHLLAAFKMPLTLHATVYPRPNDDTTMVLPLELPTHAPVLGVGISSANPLKELSEAQLLAILQGCLAAIPELHVVLIGTTSDAPRAARLQTGLQAASERVLIATGTYDLDTLPYLLRQLTLYIGVDSGITYLADACEVPVVSIAGPTNPQEQRPLRAHAQVVSSQQACVPCAFVFHAPRQCHLGQPVCVTALAMEPVITQIVTKLRQLHD